MKKENHILREGAVKPCVFLILYLTAISQAHAVTTIGTSVFGTVRSKNSDGLKSVFSTDLLVQVNNGRTVNDPNTGADDRGIFEFDISSLSGSYSSAVLSLRTANNSVKTSTIELFGYTGDGAISVDDWGAGTFLSSVTYVNPTDFSIVSFDVTDFINTMIATTDQWAGIAMRQITFSPSTATQFCGTSTSQLCQYQPQLHLTTVPVPAAIWLFGSGLVGLVGMARFKKA